MLKVKAKVSLARAAVAVRKGAPVDPPKGKGEGADDAAAQAAAKTGAIVIRKSAMMADVGPSVITALYNAEVQVAQMTTTINELKGEKRRDQLTALTLAISKVAKLETSVDLTVAFSGDPKAMERLNNQLGIALGFRQLKRSEPDKNGITYDVYEPSPAVAKCFPMPDETVNNTPDYARKKAFRANFLTQLKKCAQAASAINSTGMVAKHDQKTGTLLIEGPAVKKHFGQEKVLLNEQQTVGTGDAKVSLAQKPSFQALANMGAAEAGATVAPSRSNTRGAQAGTVGGAAAGAAAAAAVNPKLSIEGAIVSICKSLTDTLAKQAGKLSKGTIDALSTVLNAVEQRIENN